MNVSRELLKIAKELESKGKVPEALKKANIHPHAFISVGKKAVTFEISTERGDIRGSEPYRDDFFGAIATVHNILKRHGIDHEDFYEIHVQSQY